MLRRVVSALACAFVPIAMVGLAVSTANAAGGDLDSSFGSQSGFTGVGASSTTNARFFVAPGGDPVVALGGGGVEWDPDGKTLTGWSGNSTITFQANAAMDSEGRTVVVGRDVNGDLVVSRFVNGAPDNTFGTDGVVSLRYSANGSQVAVAPDGSIAVSVADYLLKLTPAGALDTTWNASGTTPGVEAAPLVVAMAFQSDGHLVVVCQMDWQQNDPCLERFNPDGSPDTTFGTGGNAPGFAEEGLGQTEYSALAIAADDSIYAGGEDDTHGDAIVAKYSSTGLPDPTFGESGVAVDPAVGSGASAPRVRYLSVSDRGVYAAITGTEGAGLVARYTSAGQRDASFADDGQLVVPQPNNAGTLIGIAVQPSGRLLAATDVGSGVEVFRFLVDGVDPVSSLTAVATSGGSALSWTNPSTPSFHQVIVRIAVGQTAPATPSAGTALYTGPGSTTTATLTAGRDYAASVFVTDYAGNPSAASTVELRGTTVATTGGTTVTDGGAITLTARLKTLGGTALAGRALTLYGHAAGASTWSKIATLTTSSTGTAAKSVKPTRDFVYEFSFAGSGTYVHSLARTAVNVKPRLTTTWGPTAFPHTTGTYVKGSLTPVGIIELQRLQSGTWHTIAKVTMSSRSTSWRFAVRPTTGKWSYRAYVPAQAGRVATSSAVAHLTAK